MIKKLSLFLLLLFLSGCATYKFQHGKEPYDKGYVVSRDNLVILEYTIDENNTVPDLEVAKERFKKRKTKVEHYYKKMGYIENRFKMAFFDPAVFFLKLVGGVFRLPFIAISDYRYEHNPQYRERVRKKEEEKDAQEEARIERLKEELRRYLQNEAAAPGVEKEIVVPQVQDEMKETKLKRREPREEVKIQKVKTKEIVGKPVAVIIAKPASGYSPLRVRFYGGKSYVRGGRIISYAWDFGDGDVSGKANPVNTYWSGSFLPQEFTVTLTVRDDQGNTAIATTNIEVLNR